MVDLKGEWQGAYIELKGGIADAAGSDSTLTGSRVHYAIYPVAEPPCDGFFKTIYSPVKQLVAGFAPDNEAGFKRVVLVELPGRGFVLGFITREFTVDRGAGPEPMAAVYVPTNHLYLGDVLVFPRSAVSYPDLTVEQGVRVFLTGWVALASTVTARHAPTESSLDSVSRA